jgi:lytTr DNA-binding domain protein
MTYFIIQEKKWIMVHVAIVDDEKNDRQLLRDCLNYVSEKKQVDFSVREFSNADSFLVGYEPEFDIVFMDIEMPGTDGMEAARQLRKMDKNVVLVFVTNIAQMAVCGYELDAVDFLVKPIEKRIFSLKMTRILARVNIEKEDTILLNISGDKVVIRAHIIKYLEVFGHYVIYHTKEGDYTEYISLNAAEKKLKGGPYVRCNRSCLVNLRCVDKVTKDSCIIGDDTLSISRYQKSSFINAYVSFLGGKNFK